MLPVLLRRRPALPTLVEDGVQASLGQTRVDHRVDLTVCLLG